MRFTNEFSTSPVTMHSVHIAVSLGSDTIDTSTDTPLYFNGNQEVTMLPGSATVSELFYFPLQPLSNVAITIYFGSTSPAFKGNLWFRRCPYFDGKGASGTGTAAFSYSLDNKSFENIGIELKMRFNLKIFTGNKCCLFNYATKELGGYVDFDWFHTSEGIANQDKL